MAKKSTKVRIRNRGKLLALANERAGLTGVPGSGLREVVAAAASAMGAPVPVGKHARWELLVKWMDWDTASQPIKYEGAVCKPRQKPIPATTKQAERLVPVTSREFLDTYAWRSLRMRVLTKRGARCECCGASPKDGIVINVDHIKPRMKFPELALEESNLQVLCDVCNHGKGNWDQTDWRADAPEVVDPMRPRLVKGA